MKSVVFIGCILLNILSLQPITFYDYRWSKIFVGDEMSFDLKRYHGETMEKMKTMYFDDDTIIIKNVGPNIYKLSHHKSCQSINNFEQNNLTHIKGIGRRKEENIKEFIKEHGPILSVEDLIQIKGIGQKLSEKIGRDRCFP